MARLKDPILVKYRKDRDDWLATLRPACGLPPQVCADWQRRSLSTIPDSLKAVHPKAVTSKKAALFLAVALVDYLKQSYEESAPTTAPTLDTWMRGFLSLDTSPRAVRLVGKGRPYSPKTITDYESMYRIHLKSDPVLSMRVDEIGEVILLQLFGRISSHKGRGGTAIAGTRQYEKLYSFVRMTFREYQLTHHGFRDPFAGLERPKAKTRPRGALEEDEVTLLFSKPNIFDDELERAICAAMFWAGLRRSEIFALKPEDLDWQTPAIHVEHAWKNFDLASRELGDPKHHKVRVTSFSDVLQTAIRELWRVNGQHEYVFSRADGTVPGAQWWQSKVKKWFKRADIDTTGRRITPHSARHSLASALEARGVPLRYIQELLGHSDLKTTYGYLQTPSDMINKITAKLDND